MIEKIVHKKKLKDASNDFLYWCSKPVEERLEALEILRAQYIQNLPDVQQRFQRVYRIAHKK
jgi:hypothetical protein